MWILELYILKFLGLQYYEISKKEFEILRVFENLNTFYFMYLLKHGDSKNILRQKIYNKENLVENHEKNKNWFLII